ncbi:MAG: Fic family protein [Verrucomicrobiae bacterium]|nr:Fic family protein [Verrucomicrobiae bacterium]
MTNDQQHSWNNIVRNGVLPSVKDLQDYENKVKKSTDAAYGFFGFYPVSTPEPTDWLNVHKIMFHQVSPDAGQIRKPQSMVMFGGKLGADSARILPELELLREQTHLMLREARTQQEQMAVVAFTHARFEHIHPFNDGNGRSGRMIMDAQLNSFFGQKKRPDIDRDAYISSLAQAHRAGDLTPLTNLLCVREGLAPLQEPIISPFRIPPCFENGTKYTLEEDLKRNEGFYQKRAQEIGENPPRFQKRPTKENKRGFKL